MHSPDLASQASNLEAALAQPGESSVESDAIDMRAERSLSSGVSETEPTALPDRVRTGRLGAGHVVPLLVGAAGSVAAIGVCEVLCRSGVISKQTAPAPSQIASTFSGLLGQASFWTAVGDTMKASIAGLFLAAVVAIPAGVLIGRVKLLWRALRPTIEFLRPIPTVALIPLIILLYGNGIEGNILLTAFAAFFSLLVQCIDGARDVDPVALDTLRLFGVSRPRRVLYVFVPSALPHVATGFRIATSVALIVTVTSELIIGTPGLGYSLVLAQNSGDLRAVYALVFATGLLGVGLHLLTKMLERRSLRWHVSQRMWDVR